jgi:NAD+ synthase
MMSDYDFSVSEAVFDKIKKHITSSIVEAMKFRHTEGALVIYSGQIDSFVTTKLTIEAIGLEKVNLVILSDVDKNRRKTIIEEANSLHSIPSDRIHAFKIKKIMNKIDAIEEIDPSIASGLSHQRIHNIGHLLLKSPYAQKLVEEKTLSNIGPQISGREKFIAKILAYSKLKKRLKTQLAYLVAESKDLLLVSKTNKTEWDLGLLTTWGYGHVGSIMPIGNLFKTQVVEISKFLNVPKNLVERTFSDIMPGVENKYQYLFQLSFHEVDQVLLRLKKGLSVSEIVGELHFKEEIVKRIEHFYTVAQYLQNLPVIPSW